VLVVVAVSSVAAAGVVDWDHVMVEEDGES
jgi:hypothetical protein